MSEIIVAGFQGTHRAAEVLDQIVNLSNEWALDLKDAVAVYRTSKGVLRLDSSVQPTSGEGAAFGGMMGAIIGSLIALPFTAGASAAVAASAIGAGAFTMGATGAVLGSADAADDKAKYGISEEFVQQVGGMVQPGQSAVFVLATPRNLDEVAERFRGYGAKILRTTLASSDARRLQQVVGTEGALAR